MGRLNQERQSKLEPIRHKETLAELQRNDFEIWNFDEKKIQILSPKGNIVHFFPYSGWFSGKGINDGRGFKNLIAQLKQQRDTNE